MENLDLFPVWAVFLGMVVVVLAAAEIGFRTGIWLQDRSSNPGETRMTGSMVGGMLGLIGFLMAFSIGIAINQHGERKSMMVNEANAIITAWLRAGFLPEPDSLSLRRLLREYAQMRLDAANQLIELPVAIVQSEKMHHQMWQVVENNVKQGNQSDVMEGLVESVNQVINVHLLRITAATKRLPSILGVILFGTTTLSFLLVGVASSSDRKRDTSAIFLFALAFVAVLMMMVDLDRPQEGILTVSQAAMTDVIRQMGPVSQ